MRMDELPSAQFRKVYASLTNPVVVTVNGHPIGRYVPIATMVDARAVEHIRPGEPPNPPPHQFSTRPFTPVPKK